MKTKIFENLGGTYTQCGDYLVPNLAAPEKKTLGTWGERRRRHLKQNNRTLYDAMLISGRLETHLAEIDREATEMIETLTEKMKALECITEKLKAEDQMAWVRAMNNIKSRAEEVVMEELITEAALKKVSAN